MSNKNTIDRTATAIAVMEKALEEARLEHASVSTAKIEAKLTAFAEVVRNTRRKMAYPAGFDWAYHSSFSVVGITPTYLKVESMKGRERVTFNVPRSDLSLSTWQVTGHIRKLSAEGVLAGLNSTVTASKTAVTKARKEVKEAEERLAKSEQTLAEASAAVERRLAKVRVIEAKKAATRARRKAAAEAASSAESSAEKIVEPTNAASDKSNVESGKKVAEVASAS
jgi:uncharacterized coiled-coil protein SlyX